MQHVIIEKAKRNSIANRIYQLGIFNPSNHSLSPVFMLQLQVTLNIIHYINNPTTEAFQAVANFFTAQNLITSKQSISVNSTIFTILGCYLCLSLISFTIIMNSLLKKHQLPVWLRRTLKSWVQFHNFVLMIPLQSISMSYSYHYSKGTLPIENDFSKTVLLIIAVLTILTNIIYAISMIQFLSNTLYSAKDKLSRTNDYSIGILLIHGFISASFLGVTTTTNSSNVNWIIIFFDFFINLINIVIVFQYPNFYDKKLRRITFIVLSLICQQSIQNLITFISIKLESYSYTPTIFTFINFFGLGIPFIARFANEFQAKLEHTIFVEIKTKKFNEYQVCVLLPEIIDRISLYNQANRDSLSFERGLIINLGVSPKFQENFTLKLKEQYIQAFLKQVSKKYPRNQLIQTIISDLLIEKEGNIFTSYNYISDYSSNNNKKKIFYSTKISTLIIKDKISQSIIESQSSNSFALQLQFFTNIINQYSEMGRQIQKQIQIRKQFYSILNGEVPKLLDLQKLAIKVQQQQLKVDRFWAKLPQKTSNYYPPLIKLYALYNLFVESRNDLATDLLKKYNKINNFDTIQHKSNFLTESQMIDLRYSLITLVGTQSKNFRKIQSCSINSPKFVGFTSQELLKTDILALFPTSLAQYHLKQFEDKLQSHLDTENEFSTEETFISTKQGHCISISLQISISSQLTHGLCFWVRIKPIPKKSQFLIVSEKGLIEGCSEAVMKDLNLENLATKAISLKSICPDFDLLSSARKAQFVAAAQTIQLDDNDLKQNSSKPRTLIFDKVLQFQQFSSQHDMMKINSNSTKLNKWKQYKIKSIKAKGSAFVINLSKRTLQQDHDSFRSLDGIDEFSDVQQEENQSHFKKYLLSDLKGETQKSSEYQVDAFDSQLIPNSAKTLQDDTHLSKIYDKTQNNSKGEYQEPLQLQCAATVSSVSSSTNSNMEEKVSIRPSNISKSGFSDSTEQKFDDKASVMSVANLKQQGVEQMLQDIEEITPFRQFKLQYLLFGSFFLIILAFLASLLSNYKEANQSIGLIQDRIDTMKLLGQVFTEISSMSSRLPIFQIYRIANRPEDEGTIRYLEFFVSETSKLSKFNLQLQSATKKLSSDIQSVFYQKNVKIYEDDFYSLHNTTKFTHTDIFQATNLLVTNALAYIANYPDRTNKIRNTAEDFLFANFFNDVWSKNQELLEFIGNKVILLKEEIVDSNFQTFIFALVTLLVTYLIVLGVYIFSYFQHRDYLRLLINHNQNDSFQKYISQLDAFDTLLNKKLYRNKNKRLAAASELNKKALNEGVKVKTRIRQWKGGSEKLLAIKSVKNAFIITIFYCILYAVIHQGRIQFINSAQQIVPTTRDLIQMNKIFSQIKTVNAQLILYVFRPGSLFNNDFPIKTLQTNILSLDDSISLSHGFMQSTQQFLHQNICPNDNQPPPPPPYSDCEQAFQGVATRGISQSVTVMQTYWDGLLKYVQSLPSPQLAIFPLIGTPDYGNSLLMTNDFLAPALDKFHVNATDSLLRELKTGADNTIRVFYVGIPLGIIVIGCLLYQQQSQLRVERKYLSKIIMILPIDTIFENKVLRTFMIKQSKKFLKLQGYYQNNRVEIDNSIVNFSSAV